MKLRLSRSPSQGQPHWGQAISVHLFLARNSRSHDQQPMAVSAQSWSGWSSTMRAGPADGLQLFQASVITQSGASLGTRSCHLGFIDRSPAGRLWSKTPSAAATRFGVRARD